MKKINKNGKNMEKEKLLKELYEKARVRDLISGTYGSIDNKEYHHLIKISKDELKEFIKFIQESDNYSTEYRHMVLDYLLLSYIGDDDIRDEFCKIEKWYS